MSDSISKIPGKRSSVHFDVENVTQLPRQRNNLPLSLTSFIGREREIIEVKRMLGTTRLLTLTGSGGAGKTRLAVQAASELVDQYAQGVWFADLAPLSEPALVVSAIASVFDLHESTDSSLRTILTNYLHAKNLLLVLDNCEHLIVACAQLAETLLLTCSNLRILATSREALNVAGEAVFRVPSLTMPDLQNAPIETLAKYEAIRLFMERATAAHHDFQMTEANAPSVVKICQRLDGMPLAIELAAARAKSLSVDQIAARLDDRFRLLTLGSRTAPTRQQTLREAINWSYYLLAEQEQALWRRLSVFAGGWTLEAVEAICGGNGLALSEILDLLARLVDKSVVVAQKDVARYHLLEAIRQYGHEKLLESAEAEMIHRRHLEWLVQFAREADPKLRGSEMKPWARRLDAELDNIRTALEWGFEHGRSSNGAELIAALDYYFFLRSNYREAKRWAEKAERLTRDAPPDIYAEALFALGAVWSYLGEYESAEPVLQQALVRYRALGNPKRVAQVLNLLGGVTAFQDKGDQAEQYYHEALTLRRAIGDTWGITQTLQNFGYIAGKKGDYARAKSIWEEGLELSEKLGDERMIARRLTDLGGIAFAQGDLKRADALLRRAVSTLWHMGEKFSLFQAIPSYAQVMVAEGQPHRAIQMLGAMEFAREELGMHPSQQERKELERIIGRIRDQLGEDGLAEALDKGRAMTLDQAVEHALAEIKIPDSSDAPVSAHSPRQAAKEKFGGLTAREREVAILVTQGKSNRDIASELVLSERTVENHIGNILSKLEMHSRSQLAAWIVEKGLHKSRS